MTDIERPTAFPEVGKVPQLDAGWNAHAAGLERETVRVLSAGNEMALLGWDVRHTLVTNRALADPDVHVGLRYGPTGEEYVTGVGEVLVNVHLPGTCAGEHCVVHNPSDHVMRDFPTHWRGDRQLMERICPHGVGHPDPDHITATRKLRGDRYADAEGVHGCDGCCRGEGPS